MSGFRSNNLLILLKYLFTVYIAFKFNNNNERKGQLEIRNEISTGNKANFEKSKAMFVWYQLRRLGRIFIKYAQLMLLVGWMDLYQIRGELIKSLLNNSIFNDKTQV